MQSRNKREGWYAGYFTKHVRAHQRFIKPCSNDAAYFLYLIIRNMRRKMVTIEITNFIR